ncbi:OLC1v1015132C1 [Oldenlandia corymbosa var. corymbosa]|uniref:OLC1v1015132C1 n=1 Tax=Oldenlandia corymbosa var. corymbosa TaxID=529605 RepID=A0AAV1E2I9_OLDCO|nr:OLC1v1015132C1 [Oldenlandia corymbosa var. corymbosa]
MLKSSYDIMSSTLEIAAGSRQIIQSTRNERKMTSVGSASCLPESSTTKGGSKKRKMDTVSGVPESSSEGPVLTSSSDDDDDVGDEIYLCEDDSFETYDPEFAKGTTALGFFFEEGIMVAADHCSKSSKTAPNIVQLNSHMLASISGGRNFCLKI